MSITDIFSWDFVVNASVCLIYLTLTITGIIFVAKAKTISKTILTGIIACFVLDILFNMIRNVVSGVLYAVGAVVCIIFGIIMFPLIGSYISDIDRANKRY